ncbi:protein kinase [Gemmatimonadota bacterium]
MEDQERLIQALADRYRIEREIGSGGMATVYLAEDLKHDRQVAVKVLKPELAAAIGAERFLAEIQTTAHLQHPNILPLFDSGEADGFLFYVMPYVEGESLRDRLNREQQLPVDEATRIVVEVAEALQAAHDDGVIHRDIKPANILLRKGKPLVADFGIALAVSAAGGGRLTETGLSLGTPHYMSPEQASADRDPDARSDVFSLGCVLYEMLTGEPPFPGSTAQAVLAKILTGEAVSPTEHRKAIPVNVEAALLRAIEKLPADRFTTVGDFAHALRDPGFRHGTEVSLAGAVTPRAWIPIGMGLGVLAGVLSAWVAWLLLQPEPPRPVGWFSLGPGETAFDIYAGLTPDGLGMIYPAPAEDGVNRLWIRRWDNVPPIPISGTNDATMWTLSPDRTEVAFITLGGKLLIASIQGGAPRTVMDSALDEPRWATDGFIYFTATTAGLSRVSASGGVVEVLTEPETESDLHYFSDVHPDRDIAITSIWSSSHWVEALRLSTGERKRVTLGEKGYLTESGYLVFASSDGGLMAAPFDPEAMAMRSPAVLITDGVYLDWLGNPFYSLSENGDLLYCRGPSTQEELEMVWVSRSGETSPVDPGWTFDAHRPNVGWALSPDGGRIAVKIATDLGPDIWIKELRDGSLRPLTYHGAEDRFPRWAPGGQSITFLSNRLGNNDIWTRQADGTGEATLLLDLRESIIEAFWSPDGEWLVFRAGGIPGQEGARDIFGFRPGVDSLPQPLVASRADETAPTISPNGRLLAYVSTETGRKEVFLSPFPEPQRWKVQVSEGGGRGPVWGGDSRELFYLADEGSTGGGAFFDSRDLWVATIDAGPPLTVGNREALFTLPEGFFFAGNTTSYLVTGDGQRFLMAREYQPPEAPERELILVQNWVELMKERVGR